MNGKYLLDTNIVIALFQAENLVIEKLNQIKNVFVPCIVIGELYFGAFKSGKTKENIVRINEFALKTIYGSRLLPCNMI